MSKIEFDFNDTHYTLEFDRDTISTAEQLFGISLNDIRELKFSTFPGLFRASFIKHHPRVSQKVTDEIYERIPEKQEFFMNLAQMYADAINTLFEEPAKGKAISWTAID